MALLFSGSPVSNVELSDSFNTWRLTTNKIINDAVSVSANNTVTGTVTMTGTLNTSTLNVTGGAQQSVSVVGNVTSNTSLDLSTSNVFDITLEANNIVLTFTNSPAAGSAASATVILRQDTVGTRFATFTNSIYTDGIAPLLSTDGSAIDVLSFFTTDGGTSFFGAQTMAAVS